MKIALIHTRLMYRGGLESRLFMYMNWLLKNGHEVSVIVYRVGRGVKIPDGVRLIKVPLFYLPKIFRQTIFDRKLAGIIKKNKFDFVLSLGRTSHHDAVLLPGNHLGYLKAINKTKLRLADKLQIKLDQKAYDAPGLVLACSKMMKDEVVKYYHADPEKIKILYPPLDVNRFHIGIKKEKQSMAEKYGISMKRKSFLLVSSSHGRKGLPLLIEVFKSLDKDKYELIVTGTGRKGNSLPNIVFTGFIKDTQELYAAVDFTVLPASYEPYGQVVAESVACGTPVIISDKVGAKEIIGPQEGIVVNGFNTHDWFEVLKNVDDSQFSINAEFASKNKLSLDNHMHRILFYKQEIVLESN